MDNVDIAQAQQAKEIKVLLAQRRLANNAQNKQSADGSYHCIDCDEKIAEKRVKLGFTVRCIACQQLYEKRKL